MQPRENIIEGGDEMELESQIMPSILNGSDPNNRVIQSKRSINDLLNTAIPTRVTNPISDISSEVGERHEFIDVYQANRLNPDFAPNIGVKIRFNVDIRKSDELDEHGMEIVSNLVQLSEAQGVQREYAAMHISVGNERFTVYYTSNHPFCCYTEDYNRAEKILYAMVQNDPRVASHLATFGGDGTGVVVEHFHTHPVIVSPVQSLGDIMAMQVHQNSMMLPIFGQNATWKSHVIPMQNNGKIISTFDPRKNFAKQEGYVQMN